MDYLNRLVRRLTRLSGATSLRTSAKARRSGSPGRLVAQEFRVIYRCRDRDQAADCLYDWNVTPTGIATRTPSIQKVGIVQPANRAEATTASYHQGGFAAHAPGCGGSPTRLDRGSGEGRMKTVMPIEYEVERDIVEYMGAHYGVEPDEITDESTLSDLRLDSLGLLAIADIVGRPR